VIVAELILVKVGLEIFGRDRMIDAIDTTLDQRPKALDGVDVIDTINVDALAMLDNAVTVSELLNVIISGKFIGMDSIIRSPGDVIPDDRHYSTSLNICGDSGFDLPLIPMRKPYNGGLTFRATTCAATRMFTANISVLRYLLTNTYHRSLPEPTESIF